VRQQQHMPGTILHESIKRRSVVGRSRDNQGLAILLCGCVQPAGMSWSVLV
jgi:hypothetical protein